METIILTGRNSKLSLIQIELVKAKIESRIPGIRVKIQTCTSLGDRLSHVPLQNVEGTDFFTAEVFEKLNSGEADIAVHSLKDMSAEHFFGGNDFSVVDRDEIRDVAIFNPDVEDKLRLGRPIVIGTCSPRRELMATGFLKEALPQFNSSVQIKTQFIRGNVDTRLKKLDGGEYDGIILAAAGLNRLLRDEKYAQSINPILAAKKIMVLPLFECTPAPCQGAIVAEALSKNKKAIGVLNQINNINLLDQCAQEKKVALKYGAGCNQKFGVATISYSNLQSVFAAGENESGRPFEDWYNLPNLDVSDNSVWDGSTETQFFQAEEIDSDLDLNYPVAFISNYKSISNKFISKIGSKRVWVAGTKTWKKLAQRGLWVEGCSDGLGLESIEEVWHSPLINIERTQVVILTNETAAENWRRKNWNAIGSYRLVPRPDVEAALPPADLYFWSSSFQFHQFKSLVKSNAIHACASGETSVKLKEAGINPVIFPTLSSFQQWKTKAIPSPIEG